MNKIRNIIVSVAILLGIFCLGYWIFGGTKYQYIDGWDKTVNARIENFLESVSDYSERKVALFDVDGTLMGQVPYYLADEALLTDASEKYHHRSDMVAREKMDIIHDMLNTTDNAGVDYVQKRIKYLAGMTPDEISDLGYRIFVEKYRDKIYPEMKVLVKNLQNYGFEVWAMTASPEFLYQKIVMTEFNIPAERIIGTKGIVRDGVMTAELVKPVPQDAGKADSVQTFIKTKPILVGGNSRGDLEMMNESAHIKIMINPDDKKIVSGKHAGAMNGMTAKQYWERDPNAIITYCNDVIVDHSFVCESFGVKQNKINAK